MTDPRRTPAPENTPQDVRVSHPATWKADLGVVLRWRDVRAEIRLYATKKRVRRQQAAAVAGETPITVDAAPTPLGSPPLNRRSSALGEAPVHERARGGLHAPRTQPVGNRNAVFGSAPAGATPITVTAASTPTRSPPQAPRLSTPRVSDLRAQLVYVAAQCT